MAKSSPDHGIEDDVDLMVQDRALKQNVAQAKEAYDESKPETVQVYHDAKDAYRENNRYWREIRQAFTPVPEGEARPGTIKTSAKVEEVSS